MATSHDFGEALSKFRLPDVVSQQAAIVGGFSGARVAKIVLANGASYCLKCWSPGTPTDRIRWIHRVLAKAVDAGCVFIATPQATVDGATVVETEHGVFDLATWQPGVADFHRAPTEARLRNAMHALASFHEAISTAALAEPAVPPCVEVRLNRLAQLREGLATEIHRASQRQSVVPRETTRRITQGFQQQHARVQEKLTAAAKPVKITPCLRDVWHDHLLFTGDIITGIIDYDAVRLDSVSTDLARLLGSLVGGDQRRWSTALDAYQEHRALSTAEIELASALDQANTILTGMQWLEWLCVREISFENRANVNQRLDAVLSRLFELDAA